MNYSIVTYLLGWILKIEGAFLLLPCLVALLYQETQGTAFMLTFLLCMVPGTVLTRKRPTNSVFFAKEGFVTVALGWILLSFMGCLPFLMTGEIPSFTDAMFEVVSGFTTTGASILPNVELLSNASLFWRSFTHWLGGMGVLVFLLAVLPMAGGYNMHLMRAESPGPSVGKLVPRMRTTALLLYGIYFGMTILQVVLLILGGMPVFDSLCTAFGTAGTGGFGIKAASIGYYSSYYLQGVITVFMILFGINFNVYYLLLVRKPGEALRCEEMRWYLGIIAASILLITWNIHDMFPSLFDAFHHAAFQVGSIITTTGFATTDFNFWPSFSKTILVTLMFIGACAGSTGGGIKVSRIILLIKSAWRELGTMIHPRSVSAIRLEGKPVERETVRTVMVFLAAYLFIFTGSLLLVSLDGKDLVTSFTAVAATLNNIGPGLETVGPNGNFASFSLPSKWVLIFDMLAGRLELFPMLLLFSPHTWHKH